MNVHEKCWARTQDHIHDGGVACPVQLQRHAPPCSERVWNFTCWRFDGCAGGGADGAMNIGIGVDMVGCLISSPMVPSLSYSAEWAKHDKFEMCWWFYVIYTLWSGLRIWMMFFGRLLCNSSRKVVQYFLHMNAEMKHDVSLPCIYLQYSLLGISEWAANGIRWGPLLVLKYIVLEMMNNMNLNILMSYLRNQVRTSNWVEV